MSRTYRLFISHSWAYGDAYEKIIKFFDNQNLDYYDHSVPLNDPIHTNGTDKQLRDAIDVKIKGTSCVIILAGVYASYSKWIQKEIEIAKSYGKPIIAVEPWDSEKTSKIVKDNAHIIVKWQSKSVVDAIKLYSV
ncbi:MAG: TIR domain-containing protein [Saprospiraceae bacterium]